MQRIGRRTKVKPEAVAQYRDWHARVWPELLLLNKQVGIRNYTIFIDGDDLFSYLEVDDFEAAAALMTGSPIGEKWQALMAPLMVSEALNPWTTLEEIFHQD